jgi:hypothetical protein
LVVGQLLLARPGEYTFHTRLTQAGRLLDENHYDLRVGGALKPPSPARRVPGFLISRVYEVGSLRATADGFMFRFHNPAMPVLVQRLVGLRVDGQLIDPAQIEVICCGQARYVAAITPEAPLEFSGGEHLTLVVHGPLLPPGRHELEITAQLFGLGDVAAHWSDQLA